MLKKAGESVKHVCLSGCAEALRCQGRQFDARPKKLFFYLDVKKNRSYIVKAVGYQNHMVYFLVTLQRQKSYEIV